MRGKTQFAKIIMLLGLGVFAITAAGQTRLPHTARRYVCFFNAVQRANTNMTLLEKLVYTYILAETTTRPSPSLGRAIQPT